jgi:hypothetical protein
LPPPFLLGASDLSQPFQSISLQRFRSGGRREPLKRGTLPRVRQLCHSLQVRPVFSIRLSKRVATEQQDGEETGGFSGNVPPSYEQT